MEANSAATVPAPNLPVRADPPVSSLVAKGVGGPTTAGALHLEVQDLHAVSIGRLNRATLSANWALLLLAERLVPAELAEERGAGLMKHGVSRHALAYGALVLHCMIWTEPLLIVALLRLRLGLNNITVHGKQEVVLALCPHAVGLLLPMVPLHLDPPQGHIWVRILHGRAPVAGSAVLVAPLPVRTTPHPHADALLLEDDVLVGNEGHVLRRHRTAWVPPHIMGCVADAYKALGKVFILTLAGAIEAPADKHSNSELRLDDVYIQREVWVRLSTLK
mmetsp:Transcript_18033/g.40666  ORF Transcript_18033/g.40666 Transcript_18033/m.40666 type:complete len:277 (-) Transcript_18033:99-929(-)